VGYKISTGRISAAICQQQKVTICGLQQEDLYVTAIEIYK